MTSRSTSADDEVKGRIQRSTSGDDGGSMAAKSESEIPADVARVLPPASRQPSNKGSGISVPRGAIPASVSNPSNARVANKIKGSTSSDNNRVQKSVGTPRRAERRPVEGSCGRAGAQPSLPGSPRADAEASKGANNVVDSRRRPGAVASASSPSRNHSETRKTEPANPPRTRSAPTSNNGSTTDSQTSSTAKAAINARTNKRNRNKKRNQRMKSQNASALDVSANSTDSFDVLDVVRARQGNLGVTEAGPAAGAFITHNNGKNQRMENEKASALASSTLGTGRLDGWDVVQERQNNVGLPKAGPTSAAFVNTHNNRRNQRMNNQKAPALASSTHRNVARERPDNLGPSKAGTTSTAEASISTQNNRRSQKMKVQKAMSSTHSTGSFDVMDAVLERQRKLGLTETRPTTIINTTYVDLEPAVAAVKEPPRNAFTPTELEAIADPTRTRPWHPETSATSNLEENAHHSSESGSMSSQFIDDEVSSKPSNESAPLLEATLVSESQAFDQQSNVVFMAEPLRAESSREGRRYWFYFGITALFVVLLVASLGIVCGTGLCSSKPTQSPTAPPTNLRAGTDSPTAAPSLQEGLSGNIFSQLTTAPTNKTNVTDAPTAPTAPPSTQMPSSSNITEVGPTTAPAASTDPSFNGTGAPTTSPSIIPSVTVSPPSSLSIIPSTSNNNDSFSNSNGIFLPEFTTKALANATSPQARGLAWLQEHPDIDDMQDWRRLQLMALATFYFATGGESWDPALPGWLNASLNECFWAPRVLCSGGHCTSLSMSFMGLDGLLPAEISFLTRLEGLDLEGNRLKSTIPTEIGLLTALGYLSTANNDFTGVIPTELGQLDELGTLLMRDTNLTGNLPTELGLLTASQMLLIDSNKFGGSIPSELGNLKQLKRLSLSFNGLTKRIPSQLGRLTSLNQLLLDNNMLTSTIPTEIGRLSNLTLLRLHWNGGLSGTIPTSLCNLTTEIKVTCTLMECCGEHCECL